MVNLEIYIGYLRAGHPLGMDRFHSAKVPVNSDHQEFYRLAEIPKPGDIYIAIFAASDVSGRNEQKELVHVPIDQHLEDILAEASSSGRQGAILVA